MQSGHRFFLFTLTLFSFLFISACSAQASGVAAVEDAPRPVWYRAASSDPIPQSCIVDELSTINTTDRQGDLLAWSPQQDSLAFVGPFERQPGGWFIGDLLIASGTGSIQRYRLPNAGIFGDVAWSPDGQNIAVVALRLNLGVYTVATLSLETGRMTDWFPDVRARTDSYSSRKGILGWLDDSTLLVAASCEQDCIQNYQIDIISGEVNPTADPPIRRRDDRSLDLTRHILPESEVDPLIFDPNWSPDETILAYFDDKNMVRIIANKSDPVILTGRFGWNGETAWSADGRYLAVRSDDLLTVFDSACLTRR